MKGMKCIQVRLVNKVYEGKNIVSCAYSCQSLVQVFFLFICVYKYCVGCCTRLLLLHSSLVVNGTRW